MSTMRPHRRQHTPRVAGLLVVGLLVVGLCGAPGCGSGTVRASDHDASGADASWDDVTVPPDGCAPLTCTTDQCGTVDDGCGADLDCGDCAALGETCGGAGVPNVCGAAHIILLAEPGCFFTVADLSSHWEAVVGGGVTYAWISIEYEAVHGGWRTDLYNRDVLNHNLMGFVRNVPDFPGRYILGNGAQIHPAHATLDRKSLFFGRVDLEEKPPGEGYTGYTTWRSSYPWQPGETYAFHIQLDAVAQQQTLQLFVGGQLDLTQVGDIPYFDPSLTAVAWTIDFGGEETPDRDIKPLGWQFCNLLIQAEPL